MKKVINLKISDYIEQNGSCRIYISNIGLQPETMRKCIDITKHFMKGDEFFFGHYRTDGSNITNEERIQYSKEIPNFFQTYGKYEPLTDLTQKKCKELSSYLTVGYLPVFNGIYEMLPKIFHYNLETIYFCSNVEWGTFVESYRKYMMHVAKDYVMNGFTDFLFSYVDSGDFSISFDINKYDKDLVYNDIENILSN